MMRKFYTVLFVFLFACNLLAQQQSPFTTPLDTIRSYDEFKRIALSMLNHNSLSNSNISISVFSLKSNKEFFGYNSQQTLVPASVTKLFTTFFSLTQFDDESTVNTSVYTDASEIKPDLDGNIYLVGRGDAMLSASDLESIAEKIKSLGIRTIKGNIYADGSYFDGMTSRFQYSGDNDEVEFVPAVTALSMGRNAATVIVSAGAVPGRPVNVQVLPTSAGFAVDVSAKVTGRKAVPAKPAVKKKKGVPAKPPTKKARKNKSYNSFEQLPDENIFDDGIPFIQKYGDFALNAKKRAKRTARSSITVKSSNLPNGKQLITVSGTLPANSNQKSYINISSPDMVVAGALLERLRTAGVQVKGNLEIKQLPKSPNHYIELATFSRPIGDFISAVNKNSDNYLAENLFKIIGSKAGNKRNNKEGAISYYRKVLDSLDIPNKDVTLNDGSGLSRRNKVSAEAIARLLVAAGNSEFSDTFATSLSVAGRDGTIRKRFIGTAAENNLIGKTGTHKNVSALAGYVNTLDGDTICFAIIENGWAVGSYKLLENRIGEMLSLLLINGK